MNILSPCPEPIVEQWLNSPPQSLEDEIGRVVLIEVFQVNCPGCFLYSLPAAVDLYQRYKDKGLSVWGIATAFEDFEINTLDNLKKLLFENIVVGETLNALTQQNRLIDNRLPYHLPFPVAMDQLNPANDIPQANLHQMAENYVSDYAKLNETEQKTARQSLNDYLKNQQRCGQTFQQFRLQGTPSHLLIDKQGRLRAVEFGYFAELEWTLGNLLAECL